MTVPNVGNYYLKKDDNSDKIIAVAIVTAIIEKNSIGGGKYPWVNCEIWTTEGFAVNTSYPIHFFEDPEGFCLCADRAQAMSLLTPITPTGMKIQSTMTEWPTILAEALNNGETFFRTDSESIRELAELAATRMGLNISIQLD